MQMNIKNIIENISGIKLMDKTELQKVKKEEATNLLQQIKSKNASSWKDKFIQDIYKEETLYPHDEMYRADKSYRYCSFIQAAVNYFVDLILGGEIYIKGSSDAESRRLNLLFEETDFKKYCEDKLIPDLIKTGNSYAERIRSGNKIVSYDPFQFPHRIYHDIDIDGTIKRFVQ